MSYIVTTEYVINKIAAPNLPLAPEEWDRRYQDQFANVLRLYFNRLDDFIARLNSSGAASFNGAGIRLPYGAFSDFTSQTATVNTATLMALSTTDFSNSVSLQTGSKITAATAGIYNLQFSVQLQNAGNAPYDIFIWLKQNGTDITGSTGKVGLPARKNPGDPFHDIKGWNYFLNMNAGDYVQIYWSTTNVDVTIPTYAASGTPTKPSTASVVATLSFVSALPT
jgi:hypothetical protein